MSVMKGAHMQLYDLGSHDLASDPRPLRFARNLLDTFRDVYRLEFPDINTAVGISGPAFPMNAPSRLFWPRSLPALTAELSRSPIRSKRGKCEL